MSGKPAPYDPSTRYLEPHNPAPRKVVFEVWVDVFSAPTQPFDSSVTILCCRRCYAVGGSPETSRGFGRRESSEGLLKRVQPFLLGQDRAQPSAHFFVLFGRFAVNVRTNTSCPPIFTTTLCTHRKN